jgi:hypothetical protein
MDFSKKHNLENFRALALKLAPIAKECDEAIQLLDDQKQSLIVGIKIPTKIATDKFEKLSLMKLMRQLKTDDVEIKLIHNRTNMKWKWLDFQITLNIQFDSSQVLDILTKVASRCNGDMLGSSRLMR